MKKARPATWQVTRKKDNANQLSVQVAGSEKEPSQTSETQQPPRGEDAGARLGHDGTPSHLCCASQGPRHHRAEELQAARTPAYRAVSTERGSSVTPRFGAVCTEQQTAGNVRGPLVTLIKEMSATFTQFWSAGYESGSLCHRETERMHPFLFPREALKISLANLTLKGP